MDVYVVRIPVKIVIEAVRLKNIDKMTKSIDKSHICSPLEAI